MHPVGYIPALACPIPFLDIKALALEFLFIGMTPTALCI
jgi:hypothetical protein